MNSPVPGSGPLDPSDLPKSTQPLDESYRPLIIRDSLAVGVATGVYGTSFGAVAVAAGLSVAQTCTLSLLMFTGASQFALVGVAAAGGTPLAGALTAVLLGTRNSLYGLRLAPLLDWRGWRRVVYAQLLIDESTALSVTRESTAAARLGFLTTGWAVFALWNAFTLLGALVGTAVGDPRDWGLDAAVGAAFIALLWPRLHNRRTQLVAACAVALALAAVPLTPAGVPVLSAAIIAVLFGLRGPRSPEGKKSAEQSPGSAS